MIGSDIRVKVVKNKVAPPFKQAEFRLMFGEEISREGEILQLGTDAKLITKSGAWYSYGHEKLDNGKDKSIQYLKNNPVLANEIEKAIRESHFEPTFSHLQNEDEPENHEIIPLDE